MKLPQSNQTHVKVPLSSLRVTTNVRTLFDDVEIEELARSIKMNGLINPITVRPPVEDENGIKLYEVIAGGRRVRAHQWLCEHGDDFSMIDCKIHVGDMLTLQLIENLQRSDLSAQEKEAAVMQMLDNGMTQSEIAAAVSKPVTWVSDIVAAAKVRSAAQGAGVDTSGISSKALGQLRSLPKAQQADALEKLAESGGTVRAATEILNEYREKSAPLDIDCGGGADKFEIEYEVPDEPRVPAATVTAPCGFPNVSDATSVSSLGRGYKVFGLFELSGVKHKLYLDGRYSNDEADEIAAELQSEIFPAASWFVEES